MTVKKACWQCRVLEEDGPFALYSLGSSSCVWKFSLICYLTRKQVLQTTVLFHVSI